MAERSVFSSLKSAALVLDFQWL